MQKMYLVPVLINYALSYLRYSPIKFGFFSSCHYCLDQPIPQEYGQKPTGPPYIFIFTESWSVFVLLGSSCQTRFFVLHVFPSVFLRQIPLYVMIRWMNNVHDPRKIRFYLFISSPILAYFIRSNQNGRPERPDERWLEPRQPVSRAFRRLPFLVGQSQPRYIWRVQSESRGKHFDFSCVEKIIWIIIFPPFFDSNFT